MLSVCDVSMCQKGVIFLETVMVSVNTIHVKHHIKDKHTSPNTHTLCTVQLKISEWKLLKIINYKLLHPCCPPIIITYGDLKDTEERMVQARTLKLPSNHSSFILNFAFSNSICEHLHASRVLKHMAGCTCIGTHSEE